MTWRAAACACASAALLWLAWHLAGGEAVLAMLAGSAPGALVLLFDRAEAHT